MRCCRARDSISRQACVIGANAAHLVIPVQRREGERRARIFAPHVHVGAVVQTRHHLAHLAVFRCLCVGQVRGAGMIWVKENVADVGAAHGIPAPPLGLSLTGPRPLPLASPSLAGRLRNPHLQERVHRQGFDKG